MLTAGARGGWQRHRTDDGRWRGVVDLGFVDGKRKRKYVSGQTQAEALGKLRQAQRDVDAGVVSDDRMTVGRFLARWSTVNLPGQVSGTTLDDYTHTIRLHLGPALGHKRLAVLTVGDVDKLWAAKRDAGYKPNTVRIMRAVLRRALAQADRQRARYVQRRGPVAGRPAEQDRDGWRPRGPTPEQWRTKLLDTYRPDGCSSYCGIREGLVRALMNNWSRPLEPPSSQLQEEASWRPMSPFRSSGFWTPSSCCFIRMRARDWNASCSTSQRGG